MMLIELSLILLGTMCLWNGIIEIAKKKQKFLEIVTKFAKSTNKDFIS